MRCAPVSLCGTLLLLVGARTAAGAVPDARSNAKHVDLVDLIIGATAGETQLLESSIRELLAAKRLDVTSRRTDAVTAQDVAAAIAPPQEATPPLARVLLDFTARGQATLFLIDPRRGRVYVRRMTLANGLDAVARASVRFVVEQSIDAILEGREIGVSREEFQRSVAPPAPVVAPPPVAPPPVAPPPAPAAASDRRVLLAGGYEMAAMGSGAYQHAAKIVAGVRFARLRLGAAAHLAAPVSIAGVGVQARLSTAGASVFGAARLFDAGDFALLAGAGVGLDMTRARVTVTAPDLQPAATPWSGGAWLQPFVQLEHTFGKLAVAIAVGAEAHLLAERYTVRTATETRDVFVPRRFRPTASALVGVVF